MCRCFSIGLIDFILKDKDLLDYTIFFPNDYEKNDKNDTKLLSIVKKMKKL